MVIKHHGIAPHKQFPSYPDTDLTKVRSFEKRQELFNTLHSEDPDHYSRLHLASFLKYVGYSLEEICDIIAKEASWSDYDHNMTYCQVRSVFRDNHTISSQGWEGGDGGNPFPRRVSPVCNERSVKREKHNREKYQSWEEYKTHLLTSHPDIWYGEFDQSYICCNCGVSVVGSFNLHIHHLSYNPNKTSFIHAGCHNREYHYNEKIRRKAATTAENPLQRVFKECTIQNTHVTCYFGECGNCTLKGDHL